MTAEQQYALALLLCCPDVFQSLHVAVLVKEVVRMPRCWLASSTMLMPSDSKMRL